MRKIGVFILFYFGTTLFMSCQDEKVKFMIPDEEMIKILTYLGSSNFKPKFEFKRQYIQFALSTDL
jgi:hypothetical protein